MGCDIHLYAEVKKKKKWFSKPGWKTLDIWEADENGNIDTPYGNRFYNGGRNYNLFAALCGVRDYCFANPPKPITAPNGIPKDSCGEIKKVVTQWEGDGHSHAYITLAQIKSYNWEPFGNTCECFMKEVVPKMEACKVPDTDVRIVFFFDN